jgi:hypothetical protein
MHFQKTRTHAPSHLREQFQEWLDSYESDRLKELDIRPVASMLDALSTCGDVLPADYCNQLEIPKGSTYAQAIEEVRQWDSKRQKTRVRSNELGLTLAASGHWTIAEDDKSLLLWQRSDGCQHCAGPVTEGDLEDLVVCVRRALASRWRTEDSDGQRRTW